MNISQATVHSPANTTPMKNPEPHPGSVTWIGTFDISRSFVTSQEMVVGQEFVGNPDGWASIKDAEAAVAQLGVGAGIFQDGERFVAKTLDFGRFAEGDAFVKFGSLTDMLAKTTLDPDHSKIEFHSSSAPFEPLRSIVSGAPDGSVRHWWK